MSDKPLFQNMDEQEAAYAPDQLPGDDPNARRPTDEITDSDRRAQPGDGVVVPAAAAGMAGGAALGGGLGTAGGMTGVPAAGPVVAGAALAGDLPAERDATTERSNEPKEGGSGQTSSG